jgi:hypothetical protein
MSQVLVELRSSDRPRSVLSAAVCVMMIAFSGCGSSSGEVNDGGPDAGRDGSDGVDAGDVDAGDREEEPFDFAIDVPAGAQACTLGHGGEGIEGVQLEYRHTGRITFRPGRVHLSRDQDTQEVDFLDKVELGPRCIQAAPAGAGVFTRFIEGSEQDGFYRYEFSQSFTVEGDPFEVVFTTRFEVRGGQPVEPVLTLGGQNLGVSPWNSAADNRIDLRGRWEDGSGWSGTWEQRYTNCDTELFEAYRIQMEIAGADTLEVEYRCPDLPDVVMLGTVCSCALANAVYSRDAHPHEIGDPFRLVYNSWNHCNYNQVTLVVFDPPVEGTAALLFWGGAFPIPATPEPTEILLLDDSFQVLETLPITDFERL